MESVENKIVFITGASSGIGEACARLFASHGARILMCARRFERLERLSEELHQQHGAMSYCFKLDVRDRKATEQSINDLPPEWKDIEILINNAGLSRELDPLFDGNPDDWDEMIDTNIKGLLFVSRTVMREMLRQGKGHIINIGSIAGVDTYPGGIVYCATKAAVRSISEGMRLDLLGTPLRVTNIQPGMVETEFSVVRFHGDKTRADAVYHGLEPLTACDIADIVYFSATRPSRVNIAELLVTPQAQVTAMVSCRNS